MSEEVLTAELPAEDSTPPKKKKKLTLGLPCACQNHMAERKNQFL